MPRPDIFSYLDYRSFLREFLTYLQSCDKKFSMRWVAKKSGIQSPQLLTMIIKGQRKLSVDNAELLALTFKLSEKEQEYLEILLELELAKNKERQIEVLDRIRFQFQNGLFKELPVFKTEYLHKWHHAVTRELLGIRQFPYSAKAIAEALAISENEAEESLQLLLHLGLLQKKAGAYVKAETSLRAADYSSPLVMLQYHLQILERAFHAVQVTRDLRHFDSLIVALPYGQIETVREKIRQLIREVDMLGESAGKRDDVFQLSVQFFSTTAGRLKGGPACAT